MARDYIPKIKKEDLIDGKYYFGRCRNATISRWFGKHEEFWYWRTKFGSTFLERIFCPEDDNVFDVFVTEREASGEEIKALPGPIERVDQTEKKQQEAVAIVGGKINPPYRRP